MSENVQDITAELEIQRNNLSKYDDLINKIKGKAFFIPFGAMATSLGTLYVGKKLLARDGTSVKRPALFQFGMGLLGIMIGVQVGALWLQREYFKMDPEGNLVRDLRQIGFIYKKLKEAKRKEESEEKLN